MGETAPSGPLVISEAKWSALPPRERARWEAMDESTAFYARKPEPPPEPSTEPTDEQLANVAAAIGFPMMATPFFQRMPHWRQAMLNLHALVQRVAFGDAEAAATLGYYRAAFGADAHTATADESSTDNERGSASTEESSPSVSPARSDQ